MKQNTVELVSKAVKGNHDAFMQLCTLYSKDILYICTKVMGNLPDGEDAAQEVFIRMQKSIRSLKQPESFRVWMNRVIQSACLNLKRSASKESGNVHLDEIVDFFPEDNSEFLPEKYAENSEDRQQLLDCIGGMNQKYRNVILLYYYEDLSLPEIAQVLGTTKATVDHRLRRAREVIRKELMGKTEPQTTALHSLGIPVITAALLRDAELLGAAQKGMAVLQASGISAGVLGLPLLTKVLLGVGAAVVTTTALTTTLILTSSGAAASNTAAPAAALTAPALSAAMAQSSVPQPDGLSAVHAEVLVPASSVAGSIYVPGEAPPTGTDGPASSVPAVSPTSQPPVASAAPAASPPPSTAALPAAEQGGAVKTPLEGRLQLQAPDGKPYQQSGAFAAGGRVQLLNAEGRLLQEADVDQNGRFQFTQLYLDAAQQCTLHAELPGSLGLAFADLNPNGSVTLGLTPGTAPTAEPVFYLVDEEAPSLGIAFYGAGGESGPVDPVRARLFVTDNVSASCQWQILDAAGGVLHSGDSTVIKPLPVAQPGQYRLRVTARDQAGNEAQAEQLFILTKNMPDSGSDAGGTT